MPLTPPTRPLPWTDARVFWPPLAATILLLVIVGVLFHQAVVLNGGTMTYTIDDAYLHLAIGKNMARHGVWGFSRLNGFGSSSSSLIWPLLLAGCERVFGDHAATPLALNLLACAGALFYAASILRRASVAGWQSFLILTAAIGLVPLPAMVATGMEHSVQILITLAFVDVAAGILTGDAPAAMAGGGTLIVLGCLLTSIRYEGLFLVGIVGLLLLGRRRWGLAVWLGVAAVPLVLYGWYSVRQGWEMLPNSVLLKGNTTIAHTPLGVWLYLTKGLRVLAVNLHLAVLTAGLTAALVIEWRRRRTPWTREILFFVMILGAIALQVQFASLGWFYRYEAYLMVLALVALGGWLAREAAALPRWRARWAVGVAVVSAAVPVMGVRSVRGMARVPLACHNIFEQQMQMAYFIHRFYEGQGVAANDVGAIDYLADIRLFDIVGLANIDVLRALRANRYDRAVVAREMARYQVRVVVIYDVFATAFGGPLPGWTPVGRWTIRDNVVCASNTVTFYAPDAALVPELVRALQEFAPALPASVIQRGMYCGERPLPSPH